MRARTIAAVLAAGMVGAGVTLVACGHDDLGEGEAGGEGDAGAETGLPESGGDVGANDASDANDAGAGLAWSACGPLQCATVAVPLDYDDPDAGTVQLAVTRSLADPAKRIGSLFVNFGGPGVSTIAVFGGHVLSILAGTGTAVTDQFDVVGVEPRGIGASSPAVACYTDAATQAALAAPLDPQDAGQWASVFSAATLLQQGCQAGNAPALMARMDSASVARDLDHVRALLGEPTISYFGASYGTYVGALYATLFPARLRAIALDSPVMNVGDRRDRWTAEAPTLDALLDQFFLWCAGSASCPFATATPRTQASVTAAYDALVAGLDATPLQTPSGPLDGAGVKLLSLVYLYSPPQAWPALGKALLAVADGDGAAFAAQLAGFIAPTDAASNNTDSAFFAISALDLPLPAGFSRSDLESFVTQSIAPIGPRVGLVSAINELPAYVSWPYAPPKPIPAVSAPTSPAALITTTAYDIVPSQWATQMQAALGAGSSLVTYQGFGHVNASAVPCLGQLVLAYLVDPKTPPATTTCAAVPF